MKRGRRKTHVLFLISLFIPCRHSQRLGRQNGFIISSWGKKSVLFSSSPLQQNDKSKTLPIFRLNEHWITANKTDGKLLDRRKRKGKDGKESSTYQEVMDLPRLSSISSLELGCLDTMLDVKGGGVKRSGHVDGMISISLAVGLTMRFGSGES